MQCVTPMFRTYQIGEHSKGHIVPRSEVMQELNFDPNYISYCLNTMNKTARDKGKGTMYEQIPCGHCWACRLNYSAQWATRLTYECMKSEHNYFITLTYDDEHLPIANKIDMKYPDGTIKETYHNNGDLIQCEGTVYEPHMKKFLHDLQQHMQRHKNHTGMKYYYCMEYGELTHRPHAHIILMNCPLDISQFYDSHIDERFKEHWKSPEIEHYWPYGMIDIASAEWSSCAYVARYCMKKIHVKNNEDYAKECKMPEFVRMSKGIGKDFYNENKKQIYNNDEIIMRTVKGNVGAFKPPKAWDKMYKDEFPEEWEQIHLNRLKCAERSRELTNSMTDMSDAQKLQLNYEKVNIKVKQLPRVGEFK